jgi:hypothetical protein
MNQRIKSPQSQPVPRSERQGFDAADVEIVNKEAKLDIKAALAGHDPLSGMEINTDRLPTPTELSYEQFMAQDMELQTMDAGSEEDNQFVEVTVNGDYRICRRGETLLCKRYHVAVLANAKELRLQQKKVVNVDGSMGYEDKMVARQTYPFSVIHDPAGRRGIDWLRAELKNAR